ncbi:MAG: hypothetical protein RL508_639 [Actinomycetota bacterium]|jgi:hypothetical protein
MAIAAIVVSRDENVAASATVAAVDSQSLKPDQIIFAADLESGLNQISADLASATDLWVWLLTPQTVPTPNSLQELQKTTELSPSAALVAPKLVNPANARIIEQYGLSLTSTWHPFSQVSSAFDQSQFDDQEDSLSAAIEGSLIRVSALNEIGGRNLKLDPLTSGYDLTMRLRLAGGRILLAPAARISVAADANFLVGRASAFSVRKAQVQLAAGFANPFGFTVLGVLAPVLAALTSIWLLLIKRPERIGSTLLAGFWWFFTLFGKFARRSHLSAQQRGGIKSLRVFFATRDEVARAQRAQIEQPAAQAERDLEVVASERPEFGSAGGFWIMAALAAISWQFWPKDVAVTGGALLPLSGSLSQLFAHAGSSWQNIGLGLAAPADPFSWVLLALGSITFWAPTLSVTLLVFLVKPLAFAAAWRALSLVTKNRGLLALGALIYALWPALTQAQVDGRLGTLVALILMPWFVFTLARVLELGAVARRSVQTWTWVGLSALLAAVISAGAPSLTPLVALVILLLAIYRFKRIGYLVWLPVPLLVLWVPLAVYLVVGLAHPLALLSDPGVPLTTQSVPIWSLLSRGFANAPFANYLPYAPAFFLLIGLFATVTRRSLNALGLWLALLSAVVCAYYLNALQFQAFGGLDGTDSQIVAGSPHALLGLAGLLLAYLVVMALDARVKVIGVLAQAGSWLVLVALAAQFVLTGTSLVWGSGTQVPALVAAQAANDPNSRTLVIAPSSTSGGPTTDGAVVSYTATIFTGAGVQQDNLSVAYRYGLANLERSMAYRAVAATTAKLVSANGSSVAADLGKLSVDFVLVQDQSSTAAVDLASALDTVKELEPVGATEYGHLWRVHAQHPVVIKADSGWSVTKLVQVAVLALFALLAVPTRRRTRASSDQDMEDLEGFDSEGGN